MRRIPIVISLFVLNTSGLDAQQPRLPTAREIVDRHVLAIGGQAAFKAVQSITARATFTLTDRSGKQTPATLEILTARPNRMLMRMTIPAVGQLEQAYNGKIGWMIHPTEGASLVEGEALTSMAASAFFDEPLHGPELIREMTVVGRETFDTRPAYKLALVLVSGSKRTEYFDVETGFQLGAEASTVLFLAEIKTRTRLQDYKPFGPLKFPTLVQSEGGLGGDTVMRFTSYELNTVAASAFDPPPAVKKLIK